MKIFQVSKGKNRKEIDCLKAQTGIARDIYDAKTISLETVNRICGVLSDMQRAMETYQVTDYEAYMGSTIQLAKNDLFVIDQIRIRTGMDVTVLSNSEHRFLGYQAVASMDGFSDMVKDCRLPCLSMGKSRQPSISCWEPYTSMKILSGCPTRPITGSRFFRSCTRSWMCSAPPS